MEGSQRPSRLRPRDGHDVASARATLTTGQTYGFAAAFGAGETFEQEVVEQLADLQRHALEYAKRDGLLAEDEFFYAEQNVRRRGPHRRHPSSRAT
ncbi:MAG: erythromycin esterase family protein [Pseudonocardiaceae bacterium]